MKDSNKEQPVKLPESELGKPVARWKTLVSKIEGGAMLIMGGVSVALGAYSLVNAPSKFRSSANMAGGAIGIAVGKAIWDSADSATRTRNYIKLSETLNAQQSAGRS